MEFIFTFARIKIYILNPFKMNNLFCKYFFNKLTKITITILCILCVIAIAIIFVEILAKTNSIVSQKHFLLLTITISLLKFLTPSISICFALAIVLVFIQLTQTQEHLAAKTLGLSFTKQLIWCFLWGTLATSICYLLIISQPKLVKNWIIHQKTTQKIPQFDLPAYNIQKLANNTIVTTSKPVKKGTYQKILLIELKNKPNTQVQIWQANSANVSVDNNKKIWQLINGNIYKFKTKSFQTLSFKKLKYLTPNKNNIININKFDTMALSNLIKTKSIEAKKALKSKVDYILMCLVLPVCAFFTFINKPRQNSWLKAVPLLCLILVYMLSLKITNNLVDKENIVHFKWIVASSHITILISTYILAKVYNKHL